MSSHYIAPSGGEPSGGDPSRGDPSRGEPSQGGTPAVLTRVVATRRAAVTPFVAIVLALAWLGAGVAVAENRIVLGDAEAAPGDTGVHVLVKAFNDQVVHGYSLAVAFPEDVLQLVEFDVCGTYAGTLGPAFVAQTVNNTFGFATLGVVFATEIQNGDEGLSALADGDSMRVIARLTFDVLPSARGGSYPIRLVNGVGSRAITNEFSSAGFGIAPELVDGKFHVGGDDILLLERKQAFCGASPQVVVNALAQHASALAGFSIGVSFDCTKLLLGPGDATLGLGVTSRLAPSQVEFFLTDLDGCRSRTAVIFDFVKPLLGQTLPAHPNAPDEILMRYVFRPINAAINCAEVSSLALRLEEVETPGAVNNTFVVESTSVTPRLYDGKIFFCAEGGGMQGRVIDSQTGLGLAGVRVEIEPGFVSTVTNGTGNFVFTSLAPGGYFLRFGLDGFYAELVSNFEVACGAPAINVVPTVTLHPRRGACGGAGARFVRSDANQDGRSDIADAVKIFGFLFLGDRERIEDCQKAADVNGTGLVDLSDGIAHLNYLFRGGSPPPAPFPDCGTDESPLPCARFIACP